MSEFDPSTIIGGPCLVSFNSQVMYVEGDVEIEFSPEYVERNVSGFKAQRYLTEMPAVIRFTPSLTTWAQLNALCPYGDVALGSRIFGDTDVSCYVQSLTESRRFTFHRCAVTRMPPLNISFVNQMAGQVEITAITDSGKAIGAADSLFTFSATANSDTSYLVNGAINDGYDSLQLSTATGLTDVAVRDGIQIDWDLSLEPITLDAHGIVDMRVTNVAARIAFIAEGVNESSLFTFEDISNGSAGQTRGLRASKNTAGDLVITSSTVTIFDTITLNNVVLQRAMRRFGVTAPAFAYEGITQPTVTTGAEDATFVIAEP